MLMEEKCAILDCGGQYTKVIDRKVRELGVKSEIFPIGVSPEKLKGFGGMILSGGPSSVWEKGAPEYDERLFDLGIPTLGTSAARLCRILKPNTVRSKFPLTRPALSLPVLNPNKRYL